MKIGIIGADGSMGRHVGRLALDDESIEITCAFTEEGSQNVGTDIGTLVGRKETGITLKEVTKLEKVLEKSTPDVVIDFTIAPATEKNAPLVISNGIHMVIGTTGLSRDFENSLPDLAKKHDAAIMLASNMAVGMNIFMNLVEHVAGLLDGWDIEIIEAHHHRKRDSPSGTALTLANRIANAIERKLENIAKYGRGRGSNPREIGAGEIGIHAIRAGDIVGDHTVLYAGDGERIELTHRAHDRSCFASGAIRAAKYVNGDGLKPGVYSMKDVLGL
ncbi:4-hydroxy-tetrahydrodipicolinate reductase [Candidatus Bathyarchaeota archaeon]|nr:4-hydroxy-tetrahydrodipicolinate reductase [Candidatus Bathyarchaeota archaeon]